MVLGFGAICGVCACAGCGGADCGQLRARASSHATEWCWALTHLIFEFLCSRVSADLNHIGVDRLRRGRVSLPGAWYFTTVCTEGRYVGLDEPAVASVLLAELQKLDTNNDLSLLATTVMPEHVHLLFKLGHQITLSQVHAKYKSMTKHVLGAAGLSWQSNFFDHRLREQVPLERFARYIYLNPYAKGIVPRTEAWPFWQLGANYTPEFVLHLENGVSPPTEWLNRMSGATSLVEEDMIGS